MGLFNKVFGGKGTSNPKLSKQEAFTGITLCTIAADGYLSDSETEAMARSLAKMQLFKGHNLEFDKILGILRNQGREAVISAAKEVLPVELRETAFAIATELALADGFMDKSEQDYLTNLSQGLEISEDTAIKIIEVMLIRNRG